MNNLRWFLLAMLIGLCAACRAADHHQDVDNEDVQHETGYVGVSGGRLYYEAAGTGEVPLLLHGNTGDRRHWDLQFEALAAEYRVVRYDVRGTVFRLCRLKTNLIPILATWSS